jgi:opacity protein-like surface antigen
MNSLMSKLALVALLTASVGMTMAAVDSQEVSAQSKGKKKGRIIKRSAKSKPQVGVRGGYILSGTSKEDTSGATELTEVPSLALNGFGLFPVAKNVFVGGGIWYYTGIKREDSKGNEEPGDAATQFDLNVMAQYDHKLNKQLSGFGYVEGGYSSFTKPGSTTTEGGVSVTREDITATGVNYGGGAGASYRVSKQLLLRGDLSYRLYSLTNEDKINTGNGEVEVNVDASRFMINIGGAFML